MTFRWDIFFVLLISFFVSAFFKVFLRFFNEICFFDEPITLIIGILSSRENFLQREAARSTWLREFASSQNSSVKALFIVGNSSCDIPPEYRLHKYGCEKWDVNFSAIEEHFVTSYSSQSGSESCETFKSFHQGFTFKVHHPVVVTKLGILDSILLLNTSVKVAILDIQTKKRIVETVIPSNKSHLLHGYVYSQTQSFLLPKDYEGLVLVEGFTKNLACHVVKWNDGGGIISFRQIYINPNHIDSVPYSSDKFSAASISLYIPDTSSLKQIIIDKEQKAVQWMIDQKALDRQLQQEVMLKNDIHVVDVIDTYRTLPIKILKFLQWVYCNHKFLYVLKTDDDCVTNVKNLLDTLQLPQFNPEKAWVLSRFRKNWVVNYIGKWAENNYKSEVYPPFPCGAAYVLSLDTIRWLSQNAEKLYPYQGEDVSMGIWLSAINPDFIEDERFECSTSCSKKSLNLAQLTVEGVYDAWSYYENCNNFCSCEESSS